MIECLQILNQTSQIQLMQQSQNIDQHISWTDRQQLKQFSSPGTSNSINYSFITQFNGFQNRNYLLSNSISARDYYRMTLDSNKRSRQNMFKQVQKKDNKELMEMVKCFNQYRKINFQQNLQVQFYRRNVQALESDIKQQIYSIEIHRKYTQRRKLKLKNMRKQAFHYRYYPKTTGKVHTNKPDKKAKNFSMHQPYLPKQFQFSARMEKGKKRPCKLNIQKANFQRQKSINKSLMLAESQIQQNDLQSPVQKLQEFKESCIKQQNFQNEFSQSNFHFKLHSAKQPIDENSFICFPPQLKKTQTYNSHEEQDQKQPQKRKLFGPEISSQLDLLDSAQLNLNNLENSVIYGSSIFKLDLQLNSPRKKPVVEESVESKDEFQQYNLPAQSNIHQKINSRFKNN